MTEGAEVGAQPGVEQSGGPQLGVGQLPLSRREVPQLLWRDSAGSTNTELVRLAADSDLPAFTTLITTNQTAGRGRLDRSWIAPAGSALAVSVVVRAPSGSGVEGLGWLPLAAGTAMSDAVTAVLPDGVPVGLKWPNDVQIDGRKVCGILSELVPHGASQRAASAGVAVVIGAGLNLTMPADQLPVPTATSLMLAGADVDAVDPARLIDRVLAAYLHSLTELVTALWQSEGDADRSGLRAAVVERCSTIGREVRVELPGGEQLIGRAVGIDTIGRLEVRDNADRVMAVAAGDIVHLR
jgi:BirA family biotin operon repressor/biotin-[acetyl-CoA-carboxylase] ligase